MSQRRCPKCQGPVFQTKRLVFREGSTKIIYECMVCERALVEDQEPQQPEPEVV
jgi:hypothetical protein